MRVEHVIGSLTVGRVEDGDRTVDIAQWLSPDASVFFVRRSRAGVVESSRVYEVDAECPCGCGPMPRLTPRITGLLFWDWIVGLAELEHDRRIADLTSRRPCGPVVVTGSHEGRILFNPPLFGNDTYVAAGGDFAEPLAHQVRSLTAGDLAPPAQLVLTPAEASG